MSVWLNELTWVDVEAYLKKEDMIIIPVGSLEQHGEGAPLGVDTYAAIAVAEDAAKAGGILSTPPIWFGDSPHHLSFPGTVSLRSNTLIQVIRDIIISLARNGFKKFILLNGHKGTNLAPLSIAGRELLQYDLPDIKIAIADPLTLCTNAKETTKDVEHHAGILEISHVVYKFPGLVKKERLLRENVDLFPRFASYIKKDLIDVAPTVHFFMGGVEIDTNWQSCVKGLFAAGEVCAGMHGGNRLSQNALAEILVSGHLAGQSAALYAKTREIEVLSPGVLEEERASQDALLRNKEGESLLDLLCGLKALMWENVGVFRNESSLREALAEVQAMRHSQISLPQKDRYFNRGMREVFEFQNMLTTAAAVIISALARKESRSAHFRTDYPQLDQKGYLLNHIVTFEHGEYKLEKKPVELKYLRPEDLYES